MDPIKDQVIAAEDPPDLRMAFQKTPPKRQAAQAFGLGQQPVTEREGPLRAVLSDKGDDGP